jgi:hypothetical protein
LGLDTREHALAAVDFGCYGTEPHAFGLGVQDFGVVHRVQSKALLPFAFSTPRVQRADGAAMDEPHEGQKGALYAKLQEVATFADVASDQEIAVVLS